MELISKKAPLTLLLLKCAQTTRRHWCLYLGAITAFKAALQTDVRAVNLPVTLSVAYVFDLMVYTVA